MGYFSEKEIELLESRTNNTPNKFICPNHFEDESIVKFIKENYTQGYCDYCQESKKVLSLKTLVDFLLEGLFKFYEEAVDFLNYDSGQGGYLGITYTNNELVQEIVGLEATPFKVIEDIVGSIDDIIWTDRYQYQMNDRDVLVFGWEHFTELIKHRFRYLFFLENNEHYQSPLAIIQEVGDLVSKLGLIKKIGKGEYIFRCRQHQRDIEVKEFDDISAPSNAQAIYPNRFSPSGIAMFYCAFDKKTTKLETVDLNNPEKPLFTIGRFLLKEDIYVIDLTSLPKLPSIFGVDNVKDYYSLSFLHYFTRDITKPIIKDGREHTEYVPTQIVTEFFKFPFNRHRNEKIEGIIYPSAQNIGNRCAVLFWDKELSNKKLNLIKCELNEIEQKSR